MTSAEIYGIICDMLLDFIKTKYRFDYGETAVSMYVYAACGYYPQETEWFKNHGVLQNVIQCVP